MGWQYTPYSPVLGATALCCGVLAVLVWRRRPASGSTLAAVSFLATAGWNAAYALELSVTDPAAQQLWANVQYICISAIPGLWLAFTLVYTGRGAWLSRTWALALFVEPVITVALAWFSDALPYLRTGAEAIHVDGYVIVDWQNGPFFWIHVAYSYVVLIASTVILIPVILRSPHLYRAQAATVTAGVLAPWLANALYLLGLSPIPYVDLTPFAFFVLAVAVGWGVFRLQFLDVVPVARDAVVEDMRDGVIVVGINDRVADVNPAAARIFGLEVGALLGREAAEVLPAIATMADTDEREIEIVDRDGARHVYELRMTPVRNHRHRACGRLAVLRDLTHRKRTEEERVRTQRLRASGELAAGIGHNLNNILVGILSPAQRLLEGGAEGTRRDAKLILAAAERARDLVRRLNRSATGDADTVLEPVDVGVVVAEVVEASRSRWEEEPKALGVEIGVGTAIGAVPRVACDATGLHDLLLNLIFNAVDALPEGGSVHIAAVPEAAGVLLSVSDDGLGMDDETRQRIFEPFFTTKVDIGSGLGLATAYRSVQEWGGRIEVESTPRAGTTFRIHLQRWSGSAVDSEAQVNDMVPPAPDDYGPRILIAEDESIVAMVMADSITALGYDVEVVDAGDVAWERLRGGGYDIALLDLGIPGLTGDEVAERARAADPALCTVLMTGWSLDDRDPRLQPFDLVIQKPFDARQVEGLIERAVRLRASRRSTP